MSYKDFQRILNGEQETGEAVSVVKQSDARNALEKYQFLVDFSFRRLKAVPVLEYGTLNEFSVPENVEMNDLSTTALLEVAELGFMPSEDLYKLVQQAERQDLYAWARFSRETVQKAIGVKAGRYQKFYSGFPESVVNRSDLELFVNAILHYTTGMRIEETNPTRRAIANLTPKKMIKHASKEEVYNAMRQLITSNSSPSDEDREDMTKIFGLFYEQTIPVLKAESIPNRETRSVFASLIIGEEDLDTSQKEGMLADLLDTANDALRVLSTEGGDDPSLSGQVKLASVPRYVRRALLSVINEHAQAEEDMASDPELWKRVGEKLHPREYANRYPHAGKAFAAVRSGAMVPTFNSKVETALKEKRVVDAANLLKTRPSLFARRIDHVLRVSEELATKGPNSDYTSEVLEKFLSCLDGVSTPVLFSLLDTLNARTTERQSYRIFAPKGQMSKLYAIEDDRKPFSLSLVGAISKGITQELVNRFGELYDDKEAPAVYIDRELKNYKIPLSVRSDSKSLETIGQGSRLKSGLETDNDILRFFVYWKNDNGRRIDIDLSAIAYDEKFDYRGHISFTDLREPWGTHSGDITDAPNGASEFIDLAPRAELLKQGVRYVSMSIYSYHGGTFEDIGEVSGGFMPRPSRGQTGDTFEAKTVTNKFDLNSASSNAVMFFYDVEADRIVWLDTTMPTGTINALETNQQMLPAVIQAFTENAQNKGTANADLYTLFMLHSIGRNAYVYEDYKEFLEVDKDNRIEFGVRNADVNGVDAHKIISEYLPEK